MRDVGATLIPRRSMLAGMVALPLLARPSALFGAAPVAGITRLNDALDQVLAPSASVEILARGFQWAEGPAWSTKGQFLIFADPPANILHRWTRADGITTFLKPSGLQTEIPPDIREAGANGRAFDNKNHLVMADSGTRAIVRLDPATGKRTILADRFDGKRFNSPNDLTIGRSGAIYFTDPPYGLAQADASPLRELDFCGLFRLAPDGTLAMLDRTHRRPNGVALSADEKTLYLALSDEDRPEILAYNLDPKGFPLSQSLFRDMRPQRAAGLPGLPDGIKIGPAGHIFATGPGGVHICTPQGQLLGIIGIGKAVANCCIGEDGRTLFMTSSDMLAMVPLSSIHA